MHYRLHILIPFICFILLGCSFSPNELKLAEKIMETSPDSALQILKHMQSVHTMSDKNRALYGLLYFQALERNNKPLQPDSLITFSTNYYIAHNENDNLAKCYFYKGRIYKTAQRFDEATLLYLKALDISKAHLNYLLLGKIYSDMGDICLIQMDYNESLKKHQKSIDYFRKAGSTIDACYNTIDVGRVYRFLKDYRRAMHYYKLSLSENSDSTLHGTAYQEIGINYYRAKKYDSAQYFLRKSLSFPYKGTSYAIRCYILADLYFDTNQFDSAFQYATKALKYPSTYFNQRDCYRILANTEYNRRDYKQMGFYLEKYQACTDSVRKIEIQTKSTVLENLHNSAQETKGTKQNMLWAVVILLSTLLIASRIAFALYHKHKNEKSKTETYKKKLTSKQAFVNQNISNKIKETRIQQFEARKTASPTERAILDKELYEKCLHLSNWEVFSCEMNHAFNQIVDVLQTDYSSITQKEIIWCCFHLLDIPNKDRILLLNGTIDSIYKLKQRLAQKLNLKSTKELDSFLKSFNEAA